LRHNKIIFSAVVCTLNSEKNIVNCLKSLKDNHVKEIILVDGKSEDNTIALAKKYCTKILLDNRKGLGNARNLGVKYTHGKYVVNFGHDNILPINSLKKLIFDLKKKNVVGVSAITKVQGNNYLSWCLNQLRRLRYKAGYANVIGTPTVFIGNVLRNNSFNKNNSHSDDSELCERLKKKFKCNFYVSKTKVLENCTSNLKSIISRWSNYGISDYEIFVNNKKKFSIKRKLISILHPLTQEFYMPIKKIKGLKKIYITPFLILIVTVRYFSWISRIFKKL
jgi:glycosyltransferase involved in cell wall biosynthesis